MNQKVVLNNFSSWAGQLSSMSECVKKSYLREKKSSSRLHKLQIDPSDISFYCQFNCDSIDNFTGESKCFVIAS